MENAYTKNFCNKSPSDVFCILMHVMQEAELFPNLMTSQSGPKKQNMLFQNFNSQILRLQFRGNCSCFCPMFLEVIQNFTVHPSLTNKLFRRTSASYSFPKQMVQCIIMAAVRSSPASYRGKFHTEVHFPILRYTSQTARIMMIATRCAVFTSAIKPEY